MTVRGLGAVCIVLLAGCVGPSTVYLSHPAIVLWSSPYPRLIVEIDHPPGVEPSELALEEMELRLRELTSKSTVVIHVESCQALAERQEWTREREDAMHSRCVDRAAPRATTTGDAAFLHITYLLGETEDAVGRAIGARAFLWPESIRRIDPDLAVEQFGADRLERSVLMHEIGHLLGLVNDGVPMVRPHEHPQSEHHSNNRASVMWPGLDSYGELLALVQANSGVPYRFDADDLADLAAFRAQESAASRN